MHPSQALKPQVSIRLELLRHDTGLNLREVPLNDAKQTAWQNSENSQKNNFLTTESFRNRHVTNEADLHVCTSMHGDRERLGMDAQIIP